MISFLQNKRLKKTNAHTLLTKQQNKFALSTKHSWLLWGCQSINIALIASEVSLWMLAVLVLCLLSHAFLLLRNKYARKKSQLTINPQKGISFSSFGLVFFAVLGCIAIGLTAKQVGLLGSMIHLLCFSYVLKAFELKARSDFYQLLLLGLFILASALIFRQDLVFSLISLVVLIFNLSILLHFFSSQKSILNNIKVVSLLLAQSAVLGIILFLVFPRISPFWQMPLAKSAETGLSDSVKPGDIANLARSNKLAFRASFMDNQLPNYSQLYWRAMVLEDYDGKQWTKSRLSLQQESVTSRKKLNSALKTDTKITTFDETITQVKPLTYQVILEPSFQKHLLALAPAVYKGNDNSIAPAVGYTFRSKTLITQAKPYELTSYLTATMSLKLSDQSYSQNLDYPVNSNPRLEQLALRLKQDLPDPESRAQAVLTMINTQNYFYTLQPPLLDNNSLDQFFFDTQKGFCVHYASAFTFIMRASGIPARMVTGYLGGEFNRQRNTDQGHLSVYQYDAHAWAEIWVQEKGWVRVDPTSAVNSERVNSGFSEQLLQERSLLNNDLFSLYQLRNIALLNMLRLKFDALDYQWTRWVIGFNSQQQYDLLKKWFGNKASWKLALIIAGSLMLTMLTLILCLQIINRSKAKRIKLATWQRSYNKVLALLTKQGMSKPAAMTVNRFAKEVREQRPDLGLVFTRFSATYTSLSYQKLTESEQIKMTLALQKQYLELKRRIKKSKII